MFPWHAKLEQINLAIESKDYSVALKLIDETVVEANRSLIDPKFLVRELKKQRQQVCQLADYVVLDIES